MAEEHTHEWTTRFLTFDQRYDCASGMSCKCGVTLDQLTVEEIVNAARPKPDYDAEGRVYESTLL